MMMMNSPQKIMSPPIYAPFGSSTPSSMKSQSHHKRAIQPAVMGPSTSSSSSMSTTTSAKKRIQFSSLGYVLPPPPPASVARRNARERNRVKQVNMGFAVLRQHIPTSFCSESSSGRSSGASSGGGGGGGDSSSKSRKVSKVDTLRCAVEYIRSLQEMLDETENGSATSTASENMSPPSFTTKSFAYGHHGSDASSPTPSYESEHSYFTASSWDPYDHYEGYEAPEYSNAVAPNEDELLDAISWWQQSQ